MTIKNLKVLTFSLVALSLPIVVHAADRSDIKLFLKQKSH